jgi:hypothetical protein
MRLIASRGDGEAVETEEDALEIVRNRVRRVTVDWFPRVAEVAAAVATARVAGSRYRRAGSVRDELQARPWSR